MGIMRKEEIAKRYAGFVAAGHKHVDTAQATGIHVDRLRVFKSAKSMNDEDVLKLSAYMDSVELSSNGIVRPSAVKNVEKTKTIEERLESGLHNAILILHDAEPDVKDRLHAVRASLRYICDHVLTPYLKDEER